MKFVRRARGQWMKSVPSIRRSSSSLILLKSVSCHQKPARMSPQEKQPVKKREFKWVTVLWAIHLHVLAIYAIWLLFTSAKWMTLFYTIFLVALATLAITAGAHRMWAHNMYKGTWLLRLFFMMAYTLAGTGTIYDWVLRHRFHHKYYGTDKDLYNHKKGFLYSHYVSNVLKENVDVEEMKRLIDMRDMEGDIFVWIQKQFYWPVFLIVGLILPLNAPLAYWDETMTETIVITGLLRFAITMNVSWLVNSARIVWGVEKGEKLMSIFDTFNLFYILFLKMPKSHGTVVIDSDGIRSK